jgi:hypothetical protein
VPDQSLHDELREWSEQVANAPTVTLSRPAIAPPDPGTSSS